MHCHFFHRVLLRSAVTILCVSACAHARAADAPTWKLEAGSQLRYRVTQTVEIAMNADGGADAALTTTNVFDTTWTVGEPAADGAAPLTLTFDRIQMSIKSPTVDVTYDSQSTDEPQGFAAMIAPTLRALAGAKFTMIMTPQGKITDVTVPDEVAEALAAAPGAQLLGEFGTPKGLKQTISQFLFELPETLEPGGEWTTSYEMGNETLGAQKVESTYRYVGPKEQDGATLEEFAPTLVVSFAGGAAATVAVNKQETAGDVLFNRTAGRLESANLEHSIDLTITDGNRQMDQTIAQTVKLEWIEDEAEEE